MDKELLNDKIFIVTGGTQGLGRGIALHLAAEGAAGLVICGRNRDNGEAVAKEIIEAGYLYIAQPPLYKLAKGKKAEYAYTEDDLIDVPTGIYQFTFTETVRITVVASFQGCESSSTLVLNSYSDTLRINRIQVKTT